MITVYSDCAYPGCSKRPSYGVAEPISSISALDMPKKDCSTSKASSAHTSDAASSLVRRSREHEARVLR